MAETCCPEAHAVHKSKPEPSLLKVVVGLVLSAVAMVASMPHLLGMEISGLTVGIAAASAFLVTVISGLHFLRAIPLIFRSANMNTLIGISILSSWGLSFWNISKHEYHAVYFDSAAFIVALVVLGQWIEAVVHRRVKKYLNDLSVFLPESCRIIKNGTEEICTVSALKVGDRIRILMGEKVPADCRVSLDSDFDFSIISGESRTVQIRRGEEVLQGAVNIGQPVDADVVRLYSESFYEKLVGSVNQSLAQKPRLQRRIDQIATWFVPFVVLLSGSMYFVWADKNIAWTAALSILVIACPCAIGLATPTAFLVGAIRAAKRGILIKSFEAIEKVSELDLIAFDKTGTLTLGRPVVNRIKAVENISHRDLLMYAASLERSSEHPYAMAILQKAAAEKIELLPVVEQIKIVPGKGVGGVLKRDGKELSVVVGNLVWLFENGYDSTKVPTDLTWEADGSHETVLWVGIDSKFCGLLFLDDELRAESRDVLQDLSQSGFQVGMITGDSENVARSFSKTLKLKFFHAGVLPEEKATIVKRLSEPKKKGLDMISEQVGFVGDGVNDAPALAAAHVGFAMGSGATISQISADIILVSNQLWSVPESIRVMKQTRSLIFQNLSLSFIYNLAALPIAAGALYGKFGILIKPEWAALAMAGSSISVLLNCLRALTFDKRRKMIKS